MWSLKSVGWPSGHVFRDAGEGFEYMFAGFWPCWVVMAKAMGNRAIRSMSVLRGAENEYDKKMRNTKNRGNNLN